MDHAATPESTNVHDAITTAATPGHPDFSAEEWQFFRDADLKAGRNIVGLMAGIFIVGFFLYAGVAWWVATWPA
jgi:hypothetical protein